MPLHIDRPGGIIRRFEGAVLRPAAESALLITPLSEVHMRRLRLCVLLLMGLFVVDQVQGRPAPRPELTPRPEPVPSHLPALEGMAAAPSQNGEVLLGRTFESRAAGISFRPPAGMRQLPRSGADRVAQFVDDQRQWHLQLSRIVYEQPRPLDTTRDLAGNELPGLLDQTVMQVMASHPAATILRQDIINIPQADVGMLAYRYSTATERRLTQQALIEANDQLYYVLTLTTPTGVGRAEDPAHEAEDSDDPQERQAVETFRQVLDSVHLMDLAEIKAEQDQRLFRTRALFVSFTPTRVKSVLVPEQWLRITRDGRDIGYSYIVEEVQTLVERGGPEGPYEGVRVGIRSRILPREGVQYDSESWLNASLDRRTEDWSVITVINDGSAEPEQVSEFGSSSRQIGRVLDPTLRGGDAQDPRQPPVRQTETYTLNARHITRSETAEPVNRDLPPFYVPQAFGHLLPRLVPLHESKTYLFASYSGEMREVMLRYVDVEREREVTLEGRRVRAVPIAERFGIDGSPTIHYISPEGEFLGTVNEETGLTILPTDAQTLQGLWDDATLTRPDEVEPPGPQSR
jgi:hypothetical protein